MTPETPPPPPQQQPDRRDPLCKETSKHDAAAATPPWRHPSPAPLPPARDHSFRSSPSPRRTSSSLSPDSSSGHYRLGGRYKRPYPDEQPHAYTPSRYDRYWQDDDAHKGFGRYRSGGGRDGQDGRGSNWRSPPRSYGSELSRSHQGERSPTTRSVFGDASADRVNRDRDEHPLRVLPWRRRDSRSTAVAAEGPAASEKSSVGTAAPQVAEEEVPRKKARLGWGQGLAKYEKQKVLGSAEAPTLEPMEGVALGGLADAEQTISETASVVAILSPAPPCGSSPVAEDKSCVWTVNTLVEPNKDVDPSIEVRHGNDKFPIRLDQLDGDSVQPLETFLADLLKSDNAYSGDSSFARCNDMQKLSLLKENISKELEKTELEIDSLESVNIRVGHQGHKDPLIIVSFAPNPSVPSDRILKAFANIENTKGISPVKELEELVPSPKIFVEHDAEVKGVEMKEIEMAPVDYAKTTSSEERAACSTIAEVCVSTIVDVGMSKASKGNRNQPYVGQDMLEAASCQVNSNLIEADGGSDFSIRPCSHRDANSNLIPSIISANKDAANKTSELVVKTLPSNSPLFDLWALYHAANHAKNDLRIKEKLAVRKNRPRFKRQLLTFKFKALHHLWKEDVRQQRPKSKKRTVASNRASKSGSKGTDTRIRASQSGSKSTDRSNQSSQGGSQKPCSSKCSRLTMPGNLNSLPIMEVSDIANELLSGFQIKRHRNYLKMPALIIDENDKRDLRFVNKSGLIEDPVSVEKEKAMINPWTQEEKECFMEMLATFGKDFSKISSFLEHKTTADCIEFYYKHHKSDSFRGVKKLLNFRKQRQPTGNYLGTISGKKWNPEASIVSLDMLGVVAAHGLGCTKRFEKKAEKSTIQTAFVSDIRSANEGSFDRVHLGKASLCEKETVAADALAGICGTLSTEAIASCITSSVDPGQNINDVEMGRPLAPVVDQSFDDEDSCSDQGCEASPVDWNDDEKSIFLDAINNYGKDFARISSCVTSKSYEQCRLFFSKAWKSLGLDLIHHGADNVGMHANDTNGVRSDTGEACAAEMDSVTCGTYSCSRMEVDVSPSAAYGTVHQNTYKQPEAATSNEQVVMEGCSAADGTIHQNTYKRPEAATLIEQVVMEGPSAADGTIYLNTSKQSEVAMLNEQVVMEGIKVEEEENKSDKKCNILDSDEQCNGTTNQGAGGPININCTRSTADLQNMENDVSLTNMQGNVALVSSPDQGAATHTGIRYDSHSVQAIQQNIVCKGICAEGSRKEGSSHHLSESVVVKTGTTPGSFSFAAEDGAKENATHLSNVADVSSSRSTFVASFQHELLVDLLPSKPKSHVTPLTPKDLLPVPFSSVIPDPTSICFEGIASLTTDDFKAHGNKVINSSGTKDLNQYPIFKAVSIDQHDALFHHINGYTTQRPNLEDIKGKSDHLLTDLPNCSESNASSKVGISQADQVAVANLQNGKSNSSGFSNSSTGMLWTQNGKDRQEGLLRPCSYGTSNESEEQLKRPGDVKLFGQILSQQSLPASGSLSSAGKSKPASPKIERTAAGPLNNSKDHVICSSRPATTGHLGLEEQAARSYGHLHASIIQPGIPSLPEPVLMMSKCHTPLTAVPFYSAKNGTLSVLAEYQQPLMHQFSSDAKKLESFADRQKRNGVELISGFQQSGKGSQLGGAGILVSGVSDPVAALKVQYASSAKILSNDVDPWRDIGSR